MKYLLLTLFIISSAFAKAGTPSVAADLDSVKIFIFYLSQTIDLRKVENPNLYFEIYRWLGKPYLLGGSSTSGIDCANFIKVIYAKIYQRNIDGNATTFFPKCSALEFSDMSAEGDLVFFKIGKSDISHVGIYLQHGKFAHATVHGGVTISDVEDPYWSKYFFKSARPEEVLSYVR
jgi:lipoprotein Spr